MKVKILEKDKLKIKFELDGASVAFANALRRTCMTDVPTYAIEEVTFLENTSVLYDEIIAHRLGLIPLASELPADLLLTKKSTTVKFTLSKEGGTAYSADLKTKDATVKPVYDKIPIVKLVEGQRLVFEAEAVLGTGKEHAKWQPTTVCAYTHPLVDAGKGKEFDKSKFIFTVESSGVLTPEEIVKAAAKILELKGKEFGAQLREL